MNKKEFDICIVGGLGHVALDEIIPWVREQIALGTI